MVDRRSFLGMIIMTSGAAGMITAVGALLYMSITYGYDKPTAPIPARGEIVPRMLMHGKMVYFTRSENRAFRDLEYASVGSFGLLFVGRLIVRRGTPR